MGEITKLHRVVKTIYYKFELCETTKKKDILGS